MICISDLHIKNKEPFYSATKQFLNYVADTYPDDEVVQLGDLFDASTVHSSVMYEVITILKRFKKFHTISGNHDQSRRSGNLLLPLDHHDNIIVYDKMTEVEIEGHKCLMLPYIHNAKEEYEKVEWSGSYMFGHFTNEEDAFGDEGVNTDKINACQIFGHTHTFATYSPHKIVLGVNLPTRNGEINNPFLRITKTFDFFSAPLIFEYQTIKYGEFPENKNNILNITDAPSYISVYEMYKDYHIRKEGIEILRTENEDTQADVEFESGNIVEKFKH